jgi:hypothetical protein
MCNFVIRPIKSYATIEVSGVRVLDLDAVEIKEQTINAGDFILVDHVNSHNEVLGALNGDKKKSAIVPMNVFIHTFTANPEDIKAAKEAEKKLFTK